MKRCWGWMLLGFTFVFLLWSLGLQAISINPRKNFEKHSVGWQRELGSPSSYRNLRTKDRWLIRSRADPEKFFFAPNGFSCVEDLGPIGSPRLEYRGPPGMNRDLRRYGRLPVVMAARAATYEGVNYASTSIFPAADGSN
jgi:hypothetical protein